MRLLLSIPWFFPEAGGGGQTYVLQVGQELQKRGHDVVVLTGKRIRSKVKPWQLDRFSYEGLDVVSIQLSDAAVRWEDSISERSPLLREGLGEILDEIQPDIVHINGFKPLLTELCVKKVIPFLVTAHHPGVVCPSGLRLNEKNEICMEIARPEVCVKCCCFQRSRRRFLGITLAVLPNSISRLFAKASACEGSIGRLIRALAYPSAIRESLTGKAFVWEKAPLWIAPSVNIRDYLRRQGIAKTRIVHVPHGIRPLPRIPPRGRCAGSLRFGYLGGFSRSKGLHVLIKAAERLISGEECEIHIYGKAANNLDQSYVDQQVKSYSGNVSLRFHDPVPPHNVITAYESFDVLVVPSILPEVFGLVVLEAFSAGRPVIVSTAGGLPELVRHEIDGMVVQANDPGALGAAMQRMLDEDTLLPFLTSNIRPSRPIQAHVNDLEKVYYQLFPRTVAENALDV